MSVITQEKQKSYQRLINVLSIAIPVAVAVLLNPRVPKIELGEWSRVLPHFNGIINSLTSLLLLAGLYFVKRKNIQMHRRLMTAAFVLGSVFLVSYVLYHVSNESTSFGGQGWVRPVYYFLLVSHIVLSVVVVRFVLLALYFALSN